MAAATSHKPKGLESSLQKLSLDNRSKQFAASQSSASRQAQAAPDSWEEDAETEDSLPSSSTSTPTPTTTSSPAHSGTSTPQESDVTPGPPPPTPISPTHRRGKSTDWSSFPTFASPPRSSGGGINTSSVSSSRRDYPRERDGAGVGFGSSPPTSASERRPEKSAATAGRLIAGALGVKAPKMGEEARQYERAVREKERKRIEREKGEKEKGEREREEAKRRVWDD